MDKKDQITVINVVLDEISGNSETVKVSADVTDQQKRDNIKNLKIYGYVFFGFLIVVIFF